MTGKSKYSSLTKRLLLVFVAGWLPMACNMIEFRPDEQLLAEVYNNRLYLEDIEGVIPAGISPGDSAARVKRYVDRWVDQQVYIHHAQQYATLDKKVVEQRLNDYRNALIIHAFEKELVENELDTIVDDDELTAYYETHKEHFRVRRHIVAVNYIKVPLDAAGVSEIRSLYRSGNPGDMEQLKDLSLEHAASYQVDADRWITFNDLIKDMPLNVDDPDAFLRSNRSAEITDDYYRYFLYIHDFRLRGDQSPLGFEKDNIRQLILSRRQKEYLQNKRRDMFNKAIEGNHVEVFL